MTAIPIKRSEDQPIAIWLLIVCLLIFAMVVLGGVTRLTESGLSIVEWKPVTGALPPLSDNAWNAEFQKYQAFPEYQKKNRGMTLGEFKRIFWFEYCHRLLGRIIGAVFFIPFLYFLFRRRIGRALGLKLGVAFVLGGLQGMLGWYMVKSGLVDQPDVSHYRLTAHLALAFLVYGYLLWLALDLLYGHIARAWRGLAAMAAGLVGLIFLQVLAGGLVAGLDAGFAYNTWPLMDGGFAPRGLLYLDSWPLNFLENGTTVQFQHRILAYIIFIAVVGLWLKGRGRARVRHGGLSLDLLLALAVLQIGLGVATLLLVVPVDVAAAHQAGALLLFSSAIFAAHRIAANEAT